MGNKVDRERHGPAHPQVDESGKRQHVQGSSHSDFSETTSTLDQEVSRMLADIESVRVHKRERLRNLDLFILDNSIRESTVGQLRSHTIENKKQIFQEVKRCGINSIIVASFSHMTRVDDHFCQWLKDEGEDFSKLFSFSEVTEGIRNGAYDTETVPISLRKN